VVVLDGSGNEYLMKIISKYFASIVISWALVNGWTCFQSSCQGAEQIAVNPADRIRSLAAEDAGLIPIEQDRPFSSSILAEASRAGLMVTSTAKVRSRTNQPFTELQQTLAVEATELQLLDFLRNIAASNSPLRIQSLSVRATPDRSRLQATMAIAGDYRLAAGEQSPELNAAQTEYLVLSKRRHLRHAALDCYNLTKSTLPSGWQLDALNFQDGMRLSVQGQAPADQVPLLEDVRAKVERAQAQDGKDLFSSGEATMRMASPNRTNFLWSMEFALRPPEAR
jgi:hypothetical protein